MVFTKEALQTLKASSELMTTSIAIISNLRIGFFIAVLVCYNGIYTFTFAKVRNEI